MSAAVSTNVPRITLNWSIRRQGNIAAQALHRRTKGDCAWLKLADLATNQTSFADTSAALGVEYEYWMERTFSGIYPSTAMGYLSAGVNVPMRDTRGKLLLVIDDTISAPLAPEITLLRNDLIGDGWAVQTLTVSRTGTVQHVKAQILDTYNADAQNVKMIYLLGHVPVPYSGNMAPDAESDHAGAWPADGYYGELNGAWTDFSVNNTASLRTQNDNTPGDGKFDQNYFPDALELTVGRVDMKGMTKAPSSSVSEVALLRRYLRKAHDFRMKQNAYASVLRRSMIRDGLGYVNGENSSMLGWAWAFTGVGTQVDEVPSGQWFSSGYAGGASYLVAYGCGEGSFEGADTVGCTADFGLRASRAVFTCFFGSNFGDWDSENCFLRAPLAGNASEDSLGLICFWGGRPNRFMHPMGMGETAGYAIQASINANFSETGGYVPNNNAGVHSALMGDPALRLYPVEPARDFSAISSNGMVHLFWTQSSEANLLGYHVYRANSVTDTFARLTLAPLSASSYDDTNTIPNQSYCYQVRVLKREYVPGGTFDNLSVGQPLSVTVKADSSSDAPQRPSRLAVAHRSSTCAQLSWADRSNNETGFLIERMTNADGAFSLIGTVSSNVTNFTDAGSFTSGNVYYYRVTATGKTDNSQPSEWTSFDAVAGYFDIPSPRVRVYKSAGIATLPVNRVGGSNGVVSVNYTTSDYTAFAGGHYASTNGTLTWGDGDSAPKTITIPVINTVAPQAARQFNIDLSEPSGAGLTASAHAAVLIEDPAASLDSAWAQTIVNGITDSSPAVTISNAICSVTLGGAGFSSSSLFEAGQFIFQSKTGDGVLTAFFPAGLPADANARYALMIRATTANNAIMAAAVTGSSSGYGTRLAYRTEAKGCTNPIFADSNSLVLGRWLRLIRTGAIFIAETSDDGSAWTTVASATISTMPASALWGVFHYSSDSTLTNQGNYHLAIAENVSLTDALPPSVPTGLVANVTSATQVSLSWPTVSFASYYSIERCSESSGFTQLVEVVSSSAQLQAWEDNTVIADCGYAYRICAHNASGSSDFSSTVYVTTTSDDVITLITTDDAGGADATVRRASPDASFGLATNLTVASTDPESWEMLADAAKTYLRFNLPSSPAPIRARLRLTFLGSVQYEDWNYYSLFFYLLGGDSNNWSEDTVCWNNAPHNIADDLGFSPPCYDLADTFDYECPEAGQETYFDLAPSVLYANRTTNNLVTIAITQFGGADMHWASKEHPSFSAPALEISCLAPTPPRPSFLTAQVCSGWTVTLLWQAGSTSINGFELERRVASGAFERIQTLASNTLSFIDQTTLPSTTYEYRLRTFNESGQSSWTPVVSVDTPDPFSAAGTLWDGGGINTFVNTPANWDRDLNPSFDGSDYYNFASGGSVVTVNTNIHFRGMSIHRDSEFLFADGGATLTLGTGGIRAVVPSSVSHVYTLASKMALSASQTWGVTNNGAAVTTLVVSGPITDGSSSFGIVKSGNGLLNLAGENEYDGLTSVAAGGAIRVSNNKGLGSTDAGTDVASNGWMEIQNNITVAEPLTLRDAGSSGALRSIGGTNVWSGPVTLAAPSRLCCSSESRLMISGGVSGAYDLLLSPEARGELVVSGAPLTVPSRKILVFGEGLVTIDTAGHVYDTMQVAGVGLRLRLGATNVLSGSSTLSVGASYSAQGIVDLNGFDQSIARLVRGTTGINSNRIVTSTSPAVLTVNETSTSPIDFNGHLTGMLGLTKGEAGYLSLSGTNNTYSGDTIVSGGTLEIGTSARLGFSSRILVNGGRLILRNTNSIVDNAVLSIADGGAKLRVETGAETIGALILGGRRASIGTWGTSGSGADNIDDSHFEGAGIVNVLTATTPTWDAGGVNTSVSTPGNWDYDSLPNFDGTASAIFGLAGSAATVDSAVGFYGICLNRNADFSFLGDGGILALGAGGITTAAPTNSSCIYTIGANILLKASQNWSVTNSATFSTALVATGQIADDESSFGITKTGSGLLTLSGDNSYDGTTFVAAGGGIRVDHERGLGSNSGITDVASNGWVEVAGSVAVSEPITLRDSGNAGALRSVSGTNVWSGSVTLTAPSRIRAEANSRLTLSGSISGNYDLLLSPEAGGELIVNSGTISLPFRKLAAYGEGSVLLFPGSHTYDVLEVAGVGMRLRMGARNVLPSTGTLSVGAKYSAQGVVDLNGFDQTVARLVRGTISISSNRIVTSSLPATLTVNESSTSPVDFNGHLTGPLGLVKGNSGYLSLSGTNNTYTGATTVKSGILEIGTSSRLGYSPLITVIGGTLRLMNGNSLADNAVVRIQTGGKMNLLSGADTVSVLYLDGKRQLRGTYGSTASSATFRSDTYFVASGTGVINVLHGPECILLIK